MSPSRVNKPADTKGLSADVALSLIAMCVQEVLGTRATVPETSSLKALSIKSKSRVAEFAAALARVLLERGFRIKAKGLDLDAGMSIAKLVNRLVKLAKPVPVAEKSLSAKLLTKPKTARAPGIGDGALVGVSRGPRDNEKSPDGRGTKGSKTAAAKKAGAKRIVLDRGRAGVAAPGGSMTPGVAPSPGGGMIWKPARAQKAKATGRESFEDRFPVIAIPIAVPPEHAGVVGGGTFPPARMSEKPKSKPAKQRGKQGSVVLPGGNGGGVPPPPPPPSTVEDLAAASRALAQQSAQLYEQMRQVQQMRQAQQMQQAQQMSHSQMFAMQQSMAAHADMHDRWLRFMRDQPAPKAAAAIKVNATPQMDFTGPPEDKLHPMAIWMDQAAAAEGAEVQGVTLQVSEDTTECRVDVWTDCSAHFAVEGLDENSHVTLVVETRISDKLPFKLRVVDETSTMPMYVTAFFRYQGRPCGKIARFPEFVDGVLRWKKAAKPAAAPTPSEVVLPLADATPAIAIESGPHADIRVEVVATKANDGQHYLMNCMAYGEMWKGDWNLGTPPRELVTALMDRFMKNKKRARIASLKGAGIDMWNTLDPSAATFLFNAIKKGATTMSVLSEEPFIPWELMVPHTTPQDAGDPLGIRLQMGRWIAGNYIAPPQLLPMKSAFLISPESTELACAATEIKFLLDTLKPSDQLTPVTIDGIDTGLAGTPRDLLHFVCHGKSGVLQTLKLNSPDELDCVTVLGLDGFLKAFQHRPMVFLNACEVGSGTASLDGVGGFANSFMQLGAAAVVAPLWAVQDKAALEVTKKFYPDALGGKPLAKIFQEIRRMSYTGDAPLDSYAAYCFYGDPLAVASVA